MKNGQFLLDKKHKIWEKTESWKRSKIKINKVFKF